MEELGEPFHRLWKLLEESHVGKEAGRVMAKVLRAIVDHSFEDVEAAVRESMNANRVDLLGLAKFKRPTEPAPIPVPEALKGFVVEKVKAADYDFLLMGGDHV